MRIGVVTTSYPRWPGDPAGSFVGAHVEAMRAMGHRVDVVAAGGGGLPASGFRLPAEDEIRVPSGLFYGAGAPDALEAGGSVIAAASFSARQMVAVARRARSWDLAIAHWLAPSAIACAMAVPARTPLLAIAHGGDVHTLRRARLLGPVLRALRARRAQLAFVTEELRGIAREAGGRWAARWIDEAIVQPMGIDIARFAAVASVRKPERIVLVVARLVPVKGVDVAIAAASELTASGDDVKLVIAGDGPERARLRNDRATLLGAVTPDERDAWLARAACVVVPSRILPNGRSEGMPLIALEALASGVPVIASRVGGLADLSAATLVPPDDPHALAAAIRAQLAAPPDPQMLRASVADLDWRLVAARLLAHAKR